jgi:hypothetical protein
VRRSRSDDAPLTSRKESLGPSCRRRFGASSRAKEALAYNALVVSWPEIVRLAAEGPMEAPGQQTLL